MLIVYKWHFQAVELPKVSGRSLKFDGSLPYPLLYRNDAD